MFCAKQVCENWAYRPHYQSPMEFDYQQQPSPKTLNSTRHKCAACFKQYKKKEHLVEHMKKSYHSVHQPKCEVCKKYCKSLESLREHITGPLPKANCSSIFTERGCNFCLKLFDTCDCLNEHKKTCWLPAPVSPIDTLQSTSYVESHSDRSFEAIAMDCEMVGGGSDGSLDLCARICLVDEDEKLIFHTYVLPQTTVTDYRNKITGITEEHLKNATPLNEVQEKVLRILHNGESIGKLRLNGGKARLLVGHDLEHDLDCLRMNYPDHMLRDTSKYHPLMKTNLVSHSLKYLTRTYLGYDIQVGVHDPYEDCVAAMRLYKLMRSQNHPVEVTGTFSDKSYLGITNIFNSFQQMDLEKMTPDELFEASKSNYKCWCLDSSQHALDT